MTKVVISNTSAVNQTVRVLAEPRGRTLYVIPIPFVYGPDKVLPPGGSFVFRYAHDTTATSTDSIRALIFTAPPLRGEVIVAVMVNPAVPEPEDTVLRIGIGPTQMSVTQPTCTDRHFAGLTNLECTAVTVKLIDFAPDTVAALISQGHVGLAGNACFSGWAITDPNDSVEVRNYASPRDALFLGQSYGAQYVGGQQGPMLTEQLDSINGYAYWTISRTAACP